MSACYAQDPKNPTPKPGQWKCIDCGCFYWPDDADDKLRCKSCAAEQTETPRREGDSLVTPPDGVVAVLANSDPLPSNLGEK
jgi:hypothetical protein